MRATLYGLLPDLPNTVPEFSLFLRFLFAV